MTVISEQLAEQLVKWRRDFHKHPELGFLEMRTASIVASTLADLGFELAYGEEVMAAEAMMGKPTETDIQAHYEWALAHGAHKDYIESFKAGMTGVVATMKMEKPGPTIAF